MIKIVLVGTNLRSFQGFLNHLLNFHTRRIMVYKPVDNSGRTHGIIKISFYICGQNKAHVRF
ncbi:MAG TPA: hypothetical protein DHV98_05600 [Flavobacteriaceae bacterium]|nr:hypothetical protein [Flavobacteriaceae bacterium]